MKRPKLEPHQEQDGLVLLTEIQDPRTTACIRVNGTTGCTTTTRQQVLRQPMVVLNREASRRYRSTFRSIVIGIPTAGLALSARCPNVFGTVFGGMCRARRSEIANQGRRGRSRATPFVAPGRPLLVRLGSALDSEGNVFGMHLCLAAKASCSTISIRRSELRPPMIRTISHEKDHYHHHANN